MEFLNLLAEVTEPGGVCRRPVHLVLLVHVGLVGNAGVEHHREKEVCGCLDDDVGIGGRPADDPGSSVLDNDVERPFAFEVEQVNAGCSSSGSLNADHRVRVAGIPKPGETVVGSGVVVAAGGKGANQAVAAARAGAPARIVGFLGEDADGEVIRRALAVESVDTSHLHIITSAPTGRAMITVDDAGENTIVVSPGANSELTFDAIAAGLDGIGPGDHLLLQLETPMSLVLHAARTAHTAGATVVVNAAPVPDTVHNLFTLTDLLVVNEHELARVAEMLECNGIRDLEHDLSAVVRASGATVICTAGSAGAYVWLGDHAAHFGAPLVRPVDTTAAGDTFIGYLTAALIGKPDNLTGAVEHAVRAAGITVTRPGAIDSIPRLSEISTTATRNRP